MNKKCSKCLKEKELDLFPKGKGMFDRHSWCKVCLSAYHKKLYKSKKKEKKVNPYAEFTLNSDLWIYFYRFGICLDHEQIEVLLNRLIMAESILAELDKIEAELSCEDYDLSGIDQRYK